jgi:hypothetical protein
MPAMSRLPARWIGGALARKSPNCSPAMSPALQGPATKLFGKETNALMQVVAEWWSDELSQPKIWAAVELTGGEKLHLHFKHKSAGGYYVICEMLRHQGSALNLVPCAGLYKL